MAPSSRPRRVALAAAALASVFLLAACAPGKGAADHFPGAPDEAKSVIEQSGGDQSQPVAVWVDEGQQIAVTTFGSSSCPTIGERIDVVKPANEGNAIAVVLAPQQKGQICTADIAPHTTTFWTPMNITTTKPLQVQVGDATVEVPVK